MKVSTALTLISLILLPFQAMAHFGMVIPSDTMVMPTDDRSVSVDFSFSHPFEGHGMNLEKPASVQIFRDGQATDATGRLAPATIMGHPSWRMQVPVKRPGVFAIVMEPRPYWEPTEDVYIIHYTKTVVAAFGEDDGWDAELGLKTEIVPLSKPYGLYAGNLFQGQVKMDGKPVPFAEVEVEYYNRGQKAKAPTDYMITQTIKAGPDGIFSYCAPRSGWWGFAALSESDQTLDYKGQAKGIELGAVIWVKFESWQEK